jgi:hypothetical protein
VSEPFPLIEIVVTIPAEVTEKQVEEIDAEFTQAVREATHPPTAIH